MNLLPDELAATIPAFYANEEIPTAEQMAVVKFFTPRHNWTWWATEYDPKTKQFFGLVQGHEEEWGYFSLKEFESLNRKTPVPTVERDMHFKPTAIKDLPTRETYDEA